MKRTRKVTKAGAVATERNRLMKLVERAEDGDQKALASPGKICQPEPTLLDVSGDVADQSLSVTLRLSDRRRFLREGAGGEENRGEDLREPIDLHDNIPTF